MRSQYNGVKDEVDDWAVNGTYVVYDLQKGQGNWLRDVWVYIVEGLARLFIGPPTGTSQSQVFCTACK